MNKVKLSQKQAEATEYSKEQKGIGYEVDLVNEIKQMLKENSWEHLVEWHRQIFKIGNIGFYKVEGKFKFYFRKER